MNHLLTIIGKRDVRDRTVGFETRAGMGKSPGMAEIPTLYVCHADEGGPPMHPCARVQKALQEAGIPYEKVIAGHGAPFRFLRRGSREAVERAAGTDKLPTLKLPDGTVISHSRAIRRWVHDQQRPRRA